ncbi:hypothetical protein [Trichloromonas sp.]|uniref:hypothetical protein n=1 Tax=Trichloromonas sp. TaxID=3069249 RepID=UPI003D8168A3
MNATEIIIRVAARQYFATLLIDGQVSRHTVLAKWPEMAVWAHRLQQELGADIYAHLKNDTADGLQTTLALARYLGSEGFIVGIETDHRHCPKPPLRLQ